MIRNTESLSMVEALNYIQKEDSEIVGFIKKFNKLNVKEAVKIREKISSLGLMKIREEHISKIIDLIPETVSDLNKIFIDVSLDEDEANKILDTIKEFK
jgi:DNA-directed RNA polymerase subunit F